MGALPLGQPLNMPLDKRLVINDLEAVAVREIFDLYEQHRSSLSVAKLLNKCCLMLVLEFEGMFTRLR